MRREIRRASGTGGRVLLEPLESRELLSATIVIGGGVGIGSGGLTIIVGNPAAPVTTPNASLNTPLGVVAVANQPFFGAVARISGSPMLPSLYKTYGVITWGDGSTSLGGLFRDGTNAMSVVGLHTYSTVGVFPITMRLLAIPPAGSNSPILTLATTQSSARVVSSPGSVSINPRAGIPFAGRVGTFSANFAANQMSATIDWGDGQTSVATLVPLTKVGTTTTFSVIGTHTYGITHSYVVRVSILKPTGIVTILSAANVLPSSI